MTTCTVLIADPTYQTALCGRTASFLCGPDLVCIFHRNAAVASIPSSAGAFKPLPAEPMAEDPEAQRFLAAFRGPRGPMR